MRSAPHTALLLLLLGLTLACAGNRTGDAGPEHVARVRIENRTNFDMDIYIHRQAGGASRLGFVSASDSAEFALPPAVVAGAVSITFEARPVRGAAQPQVSEPFAVRPGDEITWSIPPQ